MNKQVERVALLLDEEYPGWAKKINLDILDLQDLKNCILGQLYGKWSSSKSVQITGVDFSEKGYTNINSVFADNYYRQYWINEINQRNV